MWKGSPNELDYYNSFKMKFAIILGISQMSLGVFLSAFNAWQQRPLLKWLNLLTQFVPQVIFLWSIFGYMCVLIVIKWSVNWDEHGGSPDLILNVIINMFLSPGKGPVGPAYINGQNTIQHVLLALALIVIPIMLLVKPYFLKWEYQKQHHHRLVEHDEEQPSSSSHSHGGGHGGGHGEHGEEFDFGEIMIHQIIHTIEYILGAISNTASYLRLWALSLAHSELSTVFWDRVFIGQVLSGNPALAFVGFAVWAAATFAVLLIMETLSAFLHALRLHWYVYPIFHNPYKILVFFFALGCITPFPNQLCRVEFQNKFYLGDGIRFHPFDYKRVLSGEDDETE